MTTLQNLLSPSTSNILQRFLGQEVAREEARRAEARAKLQSELAAIEASATAQLTELAAALEQATTARAALAPRIEAADAAVHQAAIALHEAGFNLEANRHRLRGQIFPLASPVIARLRDYLASLREEIRAAHSVEFFERPGFLATSQEAVSNGADITAALNAVRDAATALESLPYVADRDLPAAIKTLLHPLAEACRPLRVRVHFDLDIPTA